MAKWKFGIVLVLALVLIVFGGCRTPTRPHTPVSSTPTRPHTPASSFKEKTVMRFACHYQTARYEAFQAGYRFALSDCEGMRALGDYNCPAEPVWEESMDCSSIKIQRKSR